MRSLNRPMFRMGGPIKEGVMHGIREPYRGGGVALVGNPVYPKTNGREHHAVIEPTSLETIQARNQGVMHPAMLRHLIPGKKYFKWLNRIPGAKKVWNKYKFPSKIRQTTSTAPVGMRGPMSERFTKIPFMERAGKYFKDHPYVSTFGPAYLGWTDPGQKALKMAAQAPVELAQFATEWLTPKRHEKYLPPNKWWKWKSDVKWKPGDVRGETPDSVDDKPNDLPSVEKVLTDAEKKLIEEANLKKAKAAKDKRLTELLEIMNYDKSRKNAAYDALIDASEVIRETGFKDKSILPIVKATSARFDKPEQIKEAVGLMMAKGEIEKDTRGDSDFEKKIKMITGGDPKKIKQWADTQLGEKTIGELIPGVAKGLSKSKIDSEVLKNVMSIKEPNIIAKIIGNKDELEEIKEASNFTTIEDYVNKKEKGKPGIYIIDTIVVQIDENGNVKQRY